MNEVLQRVIAGDDLGKALFLMGCGLAFVFGVQILFYLIIRFVTALSLRSGDAGKKN